MNCEVRKGRQKRPLWELLSENWENKGVHLGETWGQSRTQELPGWGGNSNPSFFFFFKYTQKRWVKRKVINETIKKKKNTQNKKLSIGSVRTWIRGFGTISLRLLSPRLCNLADVNEVMWGGGQCGCGGATEGERQAVGPRGCHTGAGRRGRARVWLLL